MDKHITTETAIKTAWMILEGLGYPKRKNIELEKTVSSVFASAPAADVRPVVYCKDCKHSDTFGSDCTEATFPLKCLSVRYGGVFPHWFCEHGERNGGADDA